VFKSKLVKDLVFFFFSFFFFFFFFLIVSGMRNLRLDEYLLGTNILLNIYIIIIYIYFNMVLNYINIVFLRIS